jgi:hypothetical protein
MKYLAILILLILPIVAVAQTSPADSLINAITQYGHIVYHQDISDGTSMPGAAIQYPVFTIGEVAGKQIVLSADVIGLYKDNNVEFAVGGSITIEHLISAFSAGIDWTARDGWGWNLSIVKIDF